jgi:NAD(P)-dependent dehydrogenase (short-subunit alcohol dehydrogenase family)
MTQSLGIDPKGKAALVTGGNRGIGEAFVRALRDAGASRVYVGSRDPAAAAHLVAEDPARTVAVRLDVTKPEQIIAAAAQCPDVRILINNAGMFHNVTLLNAPDLTAARDEMEVNYFGVLNMSRAFAPAMIADGAGCIVNVLSAGGIAASPVMGGYSPSKFAARAASTCLRAELALKGVHVSALIVGSVDTRMASHVQGKKERPEDIAAAGLKAIRRAIDEVDTDSMAVEVRASLARDPKLLERQMAKLLTMTTVSTGR